MAVVAFGTATALTVPPAIAQPHVVQQPADGSATAPTAYSAGSKLVGYSTNAWGRFPSTKAISVWTEAYINGSWSRSQTVTTDSNGNYVVPLTYGINSPGTHTFRVRGYVNNRIVTSPQFTLKRLAKPTAYSAGTKLVGYGTNTWGRFDTRQAVTAWTEAYVNGRWNRSQTVKTDSYGNYAIPLTYGINSPGTHTFRVRGQYPDGAITTSNQFTLRRVAKPTAYTAGSKPVGQTTSTWGRFDARRPLTAWTEVNVNGNWSRSQVITTESDGSHVIPLTYGTNSPGTYTYRVRGQYPDGTVATSGNVTITRTATTKQGWMLAAGIPQSDWTYVDHIVTRESGWNPRAVNPSSGACGLAQAYPCSKLGADWDDPVVSLKWQHNYVKSRYGGYQGAYNFWVRNHWY